MGKSTVKRPAGAWLLVENEGGGLRAREVGDVAPGDKIEGALDGVPKSGRSPNGEVDQTSAFRGRYSKSDNRTRLEDRALISNRDKMAVTISHRLQEFRLRSGLVEGPIYAVARGEHPAG